MTSEIYIHLAQKRKKIPEGYLTKSSFVEISDIFLSPFENFTFEKNVSQTALLLPFIGDIKLETSNFDAKLDENKGLMLGNLRDTTFTVSNNYETDIVNFIYVDFLEKQSTVPFDSILLNIASNRNIWHTIGSDAFIGEWKAREKGSFKSNANHTYFIYCVTGVFELEDRLLEAKDSLEIHNVEAFSFEALAPNSIILFFRKCT